MSADITPHLHGRPVDPVTIELSLSPEEADAAVKALCRRVLPGWSTLNDDDIKVSPITGGITNKLVKVAPQEPQSGLLPVAVKVFGANTELLVDRKGELETLLLLNDYGFGAQVLALFANGRIEEFLFSRTLEPAEMADPAYVPSIAAMLRCLHAVSRGNEATSGGGSKPPEATLWPNVWSWLEMARAVRFDDDAGKAERLASVDFAYMEGEIRELQKACDRTRSPVVFGHNDLLSGNILIVLPNPREATAPGAADNMAKPTLAAQSVSAEQSAMVVARSADVAVARAAAISAAAPAAKASNDAAAAATVAAVTAAGHATMALKGAAAGAAAALRGAVVKAVAASTKALQGLHVGGHNEVASAGKHSSTACSGQPQSYAVHAPGLASSSSHVSAETVEHRVLSTSGGLSVAQGVSGFSTADLPGLSCTTSSSSTEHHHQQQHIHLAPALGHASSIGESAATLQHQNEHVNTDTVAAAVAMGDGAATMEGIREGDSGKVEPVGTMQFIDFEYSAFTHRGFDFGNHFNEYAGFECDYSRYPDLAAQRLFFSSYLAAGRALSSPVKAAGVQAPLTAPSASIHERTDAAAYAVADVNPTAGVTLNAANTDEAEIEQLMGETAAFTLASHVFWGVWALIQARHSPIDFDYLGYSELRWNEYRRRRDELLARSVMLCGLK